MAENKCRKKLGRGKKIPLNIAKMRKLLKHLKHFPNDVQATKARDRWLNESPNVKRHSKNDKANTTCPPGQWNESVPNWNGGRRSVRMKQVTVVKQLELSNGEIVESEEKFTVLA